MREEGTASGAWPRLLVGGAGGCAGWQRPLRGGSGAVAVAVVATYTPVSSSSSSSSCSSASAAPGPLRGQCVPPVPPGKARTPAAGQGRGDRGLAGTGVPSAATTCTSCLWGDADTDPHTLWLEEDGIRCPVFLVLLPVSGSLLTEVPLLALCVQLSAAGLR